MALPKLNTPSYELEIPSTDEKIMYRPFLVKEEKILLIALESAKNEEIIRAMKEIVSECTFNKLDISNLPMFDIEYIFLNIRAKSVGEVSKLKIKCPDDGKTLAPVEIDLNKVNVEIGEGHTNKIELEEGTGIIMQYPTIDSFSKLGLTNITARNMTDIVAACILQIYEKNGEKVYNAKDQTIKELSDFVEQMNTAQFKKVQNFFDTMPKLKHKIKVKNPKTKVESEVTLQGLSDFFG
mgnify:CR=1 FL=1|tara:strand:- start:466 stop:1179 length:714 start_codon:yes stop_codon:yes gene_type:complete